MPRMRLIIVLAVVVGAFMALAPSANASLGKFINEGLSENSGTATSRARQLLEVNPKVAKAIASDMGVSANSVDWNSAKAVKKGKCYGYNTGEGSNGSVVTTSAGWYACWKFKVNLGTTTLSFNMKRNCSNFLPKNKYGTYVPNAKIISKTKILKFKKPFKLKAPLTCPNGQQVTVTVSGTVRGTLKGRVWGKIWGAYSLKVKNQVKLAIEGKIAIECGGTTPPPPPPPPYDACVNISGNQATVPGGMTVDVIGNCVNVQQACGNGSYWSDSFQACVVNICGNVVIVTGDNNDIDVGGNCNENPPPPPTCPDNRPVPPNGDCDRPPLITVIKPAHMFPNGTTYAYAKAYDPDGDEMVVNITATGPAIASVDSTVEAPSYYDGLTDTWTTCPANWKCFRARLRASGIEGAVATVTATVNAGGKSATSSIQTFPILPEQGFSN